MDSQQSEQLDALCEGLSSQASLVDASGNWPEQQLKLCKEYNVFRWFVNLEFGGWGWSESQILAGYLRLSQCCLTTTFILTQWNAACKRIAGSNNQRLRQLLLPQLASGEMFTTVGISHLSTSRQHLSAPVLQATESPDGAFLLNGFSPWVTGATAADVLVIGATLQDERQIMMAIPRERIGLTCGPGIPLVALTASCTDQVNFDNVRVEPNEVLAGPIKDVLLTNSGGGTGGLQTSTLAVGLALAATSFLMDQASKRPELVAVATKIREDVHELQSTLEKITLGTCDTSVAELRQRANSLVLRSTQAALSASKGAGFVATHPAGRWAREALFFLVWSCPQPVMTANLCELAQLS